MARYPGAVWRPVVNHSKGGMLDQRGLVLHVQQGYHSIFGWFNNPASKASAHFWVSQTGMVEQYVDTANKAWAQRAGNAHYTSVETEGYVNEPLTLEQIRELAKLYAWGHKTHGWPLVVVDSDTARGFTFHGAGYPAWGHRDCPGELRKAARELIVAKAKHLAHPPRPLGPAYPGHTLSAGSNDHINVRRVQARLSKIGFRTIADGLFGPATESSVKAAQRHFRLVADGIVGPKTWAKLFGAVTS